MAIPLFLAPGMITPGASGVTAHRGQRRREVGLSLLQKAIDPPKAVKSVAVRQAAKSAEAHSALLPS